MSRHSKEDLDIGTLLAKADLPNISTYEEWTKVLNRELGANMSVDEVISYFATEREIEDNYLNLKHCGR